MNLFITTIVFLSFYLPTAYSAPSGKAERLLLKNATNKKYQHDQGVDDKELLLQAIDYGYSGRTKIKSEIFVQIKEELVGLTSESITSPEFCDKLADILYTLPDNHILVQDKNGQRCGSEPAPCQSDEPIGKNIAYGTSWHIESRTVNALSVLVVGIYKFMPPFQDPIWTEFFATLNQLAPVHDRIIIDLRGNPGGDIIIPYRLAEFFYGTLPQIAGSFSERLQSPEALAMMANFWTHQRLNHEVLEQPVSEHIKHIEDSFLSMFELAQNDDLPPIHKQYFDYLSVKETGEINFASFQSDGIPSSLVFENFLKCIDPYRLFRFFSLVVKKGFLTVVSPPVYTLIKNIPIVLLTDTGCASSCESFLEFLEHRPKTQTMGLPTCGAVHFGDPGTIWLPKSEVWVQLGITYNSYNDGRFVERTGYVPDYILSKGDDAIDKAMELFDL